MQLEKSGVDFASGRSGIPVEQLTQIKELKLISAADDPALHALMATHWLMSQGVTGTQPVVSDDSPQNTYAKVKVDGELVATIHNGGSATMTTEAAARVGGLQDPVGLDGPNLARWRAENYAKLLGGTVEMASTAIPQSQWTPHEGISTTFSREQLDAAFQEMLAAGRQAMAQHQSPYLASQAKPGVRADWSI
ncbi:hypothetical protein [Rhodopseudomonas palustris]|uniref:hypothetical protein n=1 Tax=Rhodopseudomonas palustris TaxID=1076 RepID=UPI0021F30534|nr:hypothetical protein [Rhodopseudomonas palustris]UYO51670.1 hypothetical protein KQX61_13660 [Rhodopseudomonas palustris]